MGLWELQAWINPRLPTDYSPDKITVRVVAATVNCFHNSFLPRPIRDLKNWRQSVNNSTDALLDGYLVPYLKPTRSEPKCLTHGMVFWNSYNVQMLRSYVQKLRHAPQSSLGGLAWCHRWCSKLMYCWGSLVSSTHACNSQRPMP